MLLSGLSWNSGNLIFELVDIKINQGFESELFLIHFKVFVDESFDLGPMVLLEFIISESLYDWHGFFELLDLLFKFSLNWVRVKRFFKSHASFEVTFGFLRDMSGIDVTEWSLEPFFTHGLPVIEWFPHKASKTKLISGSIKIFKNSRLSLQNLLPFVVSHWSSFQFFKPYFKCFQHFNHFKEVTFTV